MTDAKDAATRHWGTKPVGAEVASAEIEGSPEYFHAIDAYRYGRYAPWLSDAAQWGRFAGKDLLELGCGTGADLQRFAEHGARVSAIDLSPHHLALTRRRFGLAGLDARLAKADAERLPFPSSSFDAVYSFGVLHHTSNMLAAANELRRVLRPGGVAIIAVYHLLSVNFLLTLLALWQDGYLFREPLRASLSRIEGSAGDGPLVRVLTAWQLRRLLRGYASVSITTRHVAWTGRRRPPLRRWVERHMGWYLWAECVVADRR